MLKEAHHSMITLTAIYLSGRIHFYYFLTHVILSELNNYILTDIGLKKRTFKVTS